MKNCKAYLGHKLLDQIRVGAQCSSITENRSGSFSSKSLYTFRIELMKLHPNTIQSIARVNWEEMLYMSNDTETTALAFEYW